MLCLRLEWRPVSGQGNLFLPVSWFLCRFYAVLGDKGWFIDMCDVQGRRTLDPPCPGSFPLFGRTIPGLEVKQPLTPIYIPSPLERPQTATTWPSPLPNKWKKLPSSVSAQQKHSGFISFSGVHKYLSTAVSIASVSSVSPLDWPYEQVPRIFPLWLLCHQQWPLRVNFMSSCPFQIAAVFISANFRGVQWPIVS